jgi:hypothetical protein
MYISTGQPKDSHVFSESGGICLQLLNLMLIEWDEAHVVASRVTMCSSMNIQTSQKGKKQTYVIQNVLEHHLSREKKRKGDGLPPGLVISKYV